MGIQPVPSTAVELADGTQRYDQPVGRDGRLEVEYEEQSEFESGRET